MDDVESVSPYLALFDVAANFPWQEARGEQIRERRALMDDMLIFDILLTSGRIDNTYGLYPPSDQAGLQRLLDAIEGSHYDRLKRDSLVYFLLKCHQDGRERHFQLQRTIPPQFAALTDAYWHLDYGVNVPRAVAILSDARLNREHASKIIRAISLAPDAALLIRRYVQTAKPSLVEPLDIEAYAMALADSSLLEAWHFTRTFNESDPMRPRLFKKILAWAVTPNRPPALKQLLALPLSPYEEAVLNAFVQKPYPDNLAFSALAVLQDLVCVRLLQAGRYTDAIKLDRQFTAGTDARHTKLTAPRSHMVRDAYNALTAVERSLVDMEMDESVEKTTWTPLLPKAPALLADADPVSSLSNSWEEVRMPETLLDKSISTPLREVRLPAPTSVPRPAFGGAVPPILPIPVSVSKNTSTPRKSLPLSSFASASAKPRGSLGMGTGIASPVSGFKLSAGPVGRVGHQGQEKGKGPYTFVSASKQQNAFYQPPAPPSLPSAPPALAPPLVATTQVPKKMNGVKRSFVDEEEEHATTTAHNGNGNGKPREDDVDMDMEANEDKDEDKEKSLGNGDVEHANGNAKPNSKTKSTNNSRRKSGKAEETHEDDNNDNNDETVLEYSVFARKKDPHASTTKGHSISTSRSKTKAGLQSQAKSKAAAKKAAPPGSFALDGEDQDQDQDDDEHEHEHEHAMDEDQDNEDTGRRKRTTRAKPLYTTYQAPSPSQKPPAKKARQLRERENLSRSIPGSLMMDDTDDGGHPEDQEDQEEENEEETVAPLPITRPVRKARSSVSVESEDGGVRTRRRSSRLTGGSVTGSPEPAPTPKPKPKTKRGTRAPAGAAAAGTTTTRKKR